MHPHTSHTDTYLCLRKEILREMDEEGKTSSSPSLKGIPWSVRFTLLFASTVSDFSRRSDDTLNRRLLNCLDCILKVAPRTVKGVRATDVTVDPNRDLWFRVFSPKQKHTTQAKLPVIVFFHGGAFSFLSPDIRAYDAVCRRFVQKIGAVVVSVNYRLSPENRYPAPYEDGFDTLKFLDERKFPQFPENADLTRCFLAGDSAGGNIAHHVARRAAETEFNELKVVGLIPIQPYFGGEERTESEVRLTKAPLVSVKRTDWHWKVFLPEGANRDHEAANVFGPNSADLTAVKNFPATLVFVGGFDPLQDWQRRYYQGLKRSGKEARLVEYPNGFHVFYLFPKLPECARLFQEVIEFMNRF